MKSAERTSLNPSKSGATRPWENDDSQQDNITPSILVKQNKFSINSDTQISSAGPMERTIDEDGLILPKRLPQHHTILNNNSKQCPLIRELKFNQVRGKNVLDQRSEFKKVQERILNARRRKEAEQERLKRRSSLEVRLEERAQKIAEG